jgi:hypothetical protein
MNQTMAAILITEGASCVQGCPNLTRLPVAADNIANNELTSLKMCSYRQSAACQRLGKHHRAVSYASKKTSAAKDEKMTVGPPFRLPLADNRSGIKNMVQLAAHKDKSASILFGPEALV